MERPRRGLAYCALALGVTLLAPVSLANYDPFTGSVPHLHDAQIDGTLYLDLDACTAVGATGEPVWRISLAHSLAFDGPRVVRSRIALRGLRTSLAPYGGDAYVWSGLHGQDVIVDVAAQRRGRSRLPLKCWTAGDTTLLVTDSGWRLLYERGYLKRVLTPAGEMLRVQGEGPWITHISTGSLFAPAMLLAVSYQDPITPLEITCGGVTTRLVYGPDGLQGVSGGDGSRSIQFSYTNRLLRATTVEGQTRSIDWAPVSPFGWTLKNLNPYGLVLARYGEARYTVAASQSTITVSAPTSPSPNRMIANLYQLSVRYE